VQGLEPRQAVGEVARAVLEARLKAVWHWLPLAAHHGAEDVEHVHQLRIATRRAVQAVRIFAGLLPAEAAERLRGQLRRVRLAADAARNWDVLGERFANCGCADDSGLGAHVLSRIQSRRREAQPAIIAAHHDLMADQFEQQIEILLEHVCGQSQGEAKRRLQRQAGRYLRPVLKKFFRAADADLIQDSMLHRLRIRAKKLRYTMEIVAPAWAPAFRSRLYCDVSILQDLLGTVNDHATAKALFSDWRDGAPEGEERAFLSGVLFAVTRAHRDLRDSFLAVWTPKALHRLRWRFRLCCGLP
jgi:CHAD domain-containing protein